MRSPADSSELCNPNADFQGASLRFAQRGRALVREFLAPAFADELAAELLQEEDWNLVFRDNDRHYDLHRSQWRALSAENHRLLRERVLAVAQLGFQYWYFNIPLFDMAAQNQVLGERAQQLCNLIASSPFLDRMRELTGIEEIEFADCQATKFNVGSFLSSHDDEVAGKNRYAAYVLGLTPAWRPDWGGLLTFPDAESGTGEYLLPGFNCLYLFSVPQPHLVSMVSPLAQADRLSITGWLRSEHDPSPRS